MPRRWERDDIGAPVDLAPLLAGDLAPTPLAALDPTFPILLIDLAANAQCIDDAGDQDPLAGAALWVLRWARARDFLDRLATGRAFLLRLDRDPHGEEHLNLVLNYLVFVTARRVGYEPLRRAIGEQIGPHAEAAVKTLGEQLIHEGRVLGRKEGMAEGKAEGKAEAVLLFLRARLGEVPHDLSDAIRATNSAGALDRLASVAATASSFDEIRAAMRA